MSTRPEEASNDQVQVPAKAPRKTRKRSLEDHQFDGLFGELEESLAGVEERITTVGDQKAAMFNQITARIEQEVNVDNIDAFDRAMGRVRESYLSRLREDLKTRFDRLRIKDLDDYFIQQLKAMNAADEMCLVRIGPDRLAKSFVIELSRSIAAFVENTNTKPEQEPEICGRIRCENNLTSFECIKWCNANLFSPDSFNSKTNFVFNAKRVKIRLEQRTAASRPSFHDCYLLFDIIDHTKKGGGDQQVVQFSSIPFEMGYNVHDAPATFYSFGRRLLMVTSFSQLYPVRNLHALRKADHAGVLPERTHNGHICHFVLFDANLNLVKEFIVTESRQLAYHSIDIDFINERGIMVSKVFKSSSSSSNTFRTKRGVKVCTKRLVTFYDYHFKPVFQDLELPDSAKIANIVQIDANANLISYVSSDPADEKKQITFNVYDLGTKSVVSSKLVPRKNNRFISPTKYLLDSKNNLYSIQKSNFGYRSVTKTHGYLVGCVNVDSHEWHEIDPQAEGVYYRGSYVDENDQLTIVSSRYSDNTILFNSFAF